MKRLKRKKRDFKVPENVKQYFPPVSPMRSESHTRWDKDGKRAPTLKMDKRQRRCPYDWRN